jgi:predicted enzyme related to lactoylglutathione lyase
MEFVHFTNLDVMPGGTRLQDPGNATLVLGVRDVAATTVAVQKAGGAIVTTGMPTLGLPNAKPFTTVRDPDGFLIVVGELPSLAAGDSGAPVSSARVALTVDNLDRAVAFYQKLGLKAEALTNPFATSMGTLRQIQISGPGTPVMLLLLEFQGVERKAFRKRLSDYGTPAIALNVRDCDAAAGIVKASGGSVYSTGGECMHQMQNGMPFNRAFVRDADGFLLEFLQRGNP